MALFNVDERKLTQKPVIPELHEPAYRSVQEDLRYISRERIINYIAGFPWVVTYYAQVLGKDSELTGRSTSTSPVDQPLWKVNNFEIRVSSPVSTNQNDNKDMSVTGSATIFPCLIPNVGDQFVADAGDGRLGIYQVTQSRRLSHFKETVHDIEFVLLVYADKGQVSDLERKVVRESHFRRDYMDYGQSPLIENDDHGWVHEFEERYAQILALYFHENISIEFQTFIVPGQPESIYDPFLTQFVLGLFSTFSKTNYPEVRRLNISNDEGTRVKTLWDVLHDQDQHLLPHSSSRMATTSARSFGGLPMFNSIRYSGIKSVVYPIDGLTTIDATAAPRLKGTMGGLTPTSGSTGSPEGPGEQKHDEEGNVIESYFEAPERPLVHPVTIDDYYVLSKAFYDDTESQSVLEIEIRRFINRGGINIPAIRALLVDYHNWRGVERFYYTPLLLILLNSAIRSL